MSRIKREINPEPSRRLKQIISDQSITQQELADLIHYTQQTISKIINQKAALTDSFADAIIKLFPEYRKAWLMGIDDFKTDADIVRNANIQAMEQLKAVQDAAISKAEGFYLVAAASGHRIRNTVDFDPLMNDDEALKYLDSISDLSDYYTIEHPDGSFTMSMDEYKSLERELIEFLEFKLQKMRKDKLV